MSKSKKDPDFVMLFQGRNGLFRKAIQSSLTRTESNILYYFLDRMQWDSSVDYTPKQIADALGLDRSNFAKASMRLCEIGILAVSGKGRSKKFSLPMHLGYKGFLKTRKAKMIRKSEADAKKAIKELHSQAPNIVSLYGD